MGLRGLDELPELAPFLPEAEAIEAETQEGVPSFDPDAPDDVVPGSRPATPGTDDEDDQTEL
jgi:segregation and condensation protein B